MLADIRHTRAVVHIATWVAVVLSLAAIPLSGQESVPRVSLRALVIGNDKYPSVPLRNAGNDAASMYQVFENRGFTTTLVRDNFLSTLEGHINDFVNGLKELDTVVIFYAGHGMQIAGDNYIIPVDFAANNETEAKRKAVSINALMESVARVRPRFTLLILDACRD